jgi:ribosomal protein S14
MLRLAIKNWRRQFDKFNLCRVVLRVAARAGLN